MPSPRGIGSSYQGVGGYGCAMYVGIGCDSMRDVGMERGGVRCVGVGCVE